MTSIIFPGQGSQFIGMAKDFFDNFNSAKLVFEEVEDSTSIKIRSIIFEDKLNQLDLTKYTQICIFTASLSIFKVIKELNFYNSLNVKTMLGHSLGEYSAIAASGKISINEAAKLLKIRSALMNDVITPNISSMAALIGLNSNQVENIIKEKKLNVYVANDNSPHQVVISGMVKEINNSKDIFLQNGIKKFVLLNVSAAFHSPIMLNAEKCMKEHIQNYNFLENDISIISNYNANISNKNQDIKMALMSQIANKVCWTQSIQNLEKTNDFKILEIGPGKVLSGLIKRISNNFSINTINSINDLESIEVFK